MHACMHARKDEFARVQHRTSQTQTQSYRARRLCLHKVQEDRGIKQRAERCHKGNATVQGPEPPHTKHCSIPSITQDNTILAFSAL
eukprot:364495-Chlamydomonas_euryale.AAC.12